MVEEVNELRFSVNIRGFDWRLFLLRKIVNAAGNIEARRKLISLRDTYVSTAHDSVRTYIHVDRTGVAIRATRGHGYEDRMICVVQCSVVLCGVREIWLEEG
jgi:hypothetical protein